MRTRSAATTQHQVVQALQRPHHARPPWTSHLPTGRACGQPLRGSWPAHRSPADAFGLTRFACPTPIDQRTQTLRQRPALSDPTQIPQTTDTSTVLPGGVWGGHRWRNLKWPSGFQIEAIVGMARWECSSLSQAGKAGRRRLCVPRLAADARADLEDCLWNNSPCRLAAWSGSSKRSP